MVAFSRTKMAVEGLQILRESRMTPEEKAQREVRLKLNHFVPAVKVEQVI